MEWQLYQGQLSGGQQLPPPPPTELSLRIQKLEADILAMQREILRINGVNI